MEQRQMNRYFVYANQARLPFIPTIQQRHNGATSTSLTSLITLITDIERGSWSKDSSFLRADEVVSERANEVPRVGPGNQESVARNSCRFQPTRPGNHL